MLTLNSNQRWTESEKQVWSEFVVYFMVYSTLLVGFGIASDDSGVMLDSFRIDEWEDYQHEQTMKIIYLWQTHSWLMEQAMGLVTYDEVIVDTSLNLGEKAVEGIKKEILMPIGGFVVGGLKKLSPFGSASAQVNSWDGSASTDWQDPDNWSMNQIPDQAFVIEIPSAPSNQPDLNTADGEVGSLFICDGATLTGSGREVDVYGEHPGTSENVCSSDGGGGTYGDGFAFLVAGEISGNLKLEIKSPMFTFVDLHADDGGNVYDLNINTSGNYVESTGSPTINGDVTVTDGVLRSSSYGTTMTIGGKLTIKNGSVFGYEGGNAGAMNYTLGSLDIEGGGKFVNGYQSTTEITTTTAGNIFQIDDGGMFIHNNGLVKFTGGTSGQCTIYIGSTTGYSNHFYDLTIDGQANGDLWKLERDTGVDNDTKLHRGALNSNGSRTHDFYGKFYNGIGNGSQTSYLRLYADNVTWNFHGLFIHDNGGSVQAHPSNDYPDLHLYFYGGIHIIHPGNGFGLTGNMYASSVINDHGCNVFSRAVGRANNFFKMIGTGGVLDGCFTTTAATAEAMAFDIDLDYALTFNGSNQYVGLPDTMAQTWTDGLTSSAWVYRTGTDEDFINVLDSGGGFSWSIFTDGRVWWYANDLSLTSGQTPTSPSTLRVPSDSWQHVAISYNPDADSVTVYLNGKIMWDWCPSGCGSTATITGTIVNSTSHNNIGKWSSSSYNWEGRIADSRFYAEPLDISEIELLASRINRATPTTPEAWYKLNEGTGLPQDYSGNGHHATYYTTSDMWIYSPYSIDLPEVDPPQGSVFEENITVTNGTLNGLALTSADFSGSIQEYKGLLTAEQKDSNQYTVSFWFNADDATQRMLIGRFNGTSHASENGIYLDASSNLVAKVNTTASPPGGTPTSQTVTGSTTIVAGTWYHVTLVMTGVDDGDFIKLYLDGVLEASMSGHGEYLQNKGNEFRIGYGYGGSNFFDGNMRDVKMFAGNALSETAVTSLYAGTYPVTPEFWLKLDDDNGDSLPASSGLYTWTSTTVAGAPRTWRNADVNIGNLFLSSIGGTYSAARGETIIDGYPYVKGVNTAYSWKHNVGTLVHNNGTVHIQFDGTDGVHMQVPDPTVAGRGGIYDLKATLPTGGWATARINWRPYDHDTFNIENDFTLIEGRFRPGASDAHNLTVGGHMTVESGGILGYPDSPSYTGTWSFGSLRIETGGIYYATSGTTYIPGLSGTNWETYAWWTDGSWTHNNGTVHFDLQDSGVHYIEEDFFYDLVIENYGSGNQIRFTDDTAGVGLTVYGDFTVVEGTFFMHTPSDPMVIHGTTHVQQGATLGDGAQNRGGDNTFYGLLTNEGTFITSQGANFFYNGLRTSNAFAALSTDTVTFKGTGGIWEGDLDDVNVVVDLDAALEIKSSCTNAAYLNYFTCTDNGGTWSGTIARVSDDTVIRLAGSCSAGGHLNKTACETAGETWTGSDKTLSIWYKTPGPEEFAQLLSTGGDSSNLMAKYYYTYSLKIRWFSTGGDVLCDDSSAAYRYSTGRPIDQPDTWYHIACTGDWDAVANGQDNLQTFVNGINVSNSSGTNSDGGSSASTGALYFGGHAGNPPDLVGTIADAKIYNVILTDADILKLASYINYPNSQLADAGFLKGSWAFNEGAFNTCSNGEDVCDLSGNNNTVQFTNNSGGGADYANWVYPYSLYLMHSATLDGDLTVTEGTLDGSGLSSLEFDGVDDMITINDDSLNFTNNFTLSMWYYHKSHDYGGLMSNPGTCCQDNGYNWRIDQGGSHELIVSGNGTLRGDNLESPQLPINEWVHLAATYSSTGTISIYTNGILVGTETGSEILDPADQPFTMGCYQWEGGNKYCGESKISNAKVYDYALSEEQVAALYGGSYPVTPEHWWKFGGEAIDRNGVISDHGTASFLNPDDVYSGNGVSGAPQNSEWRNGNCDTFTKHGDPENTFTCVESTGSYSGFDDSSKGLWETPGLGDTFTGEVFVAEFDFVWNSGTGTINFYMMNQAVGSGYGGPYNVSMVPASNGHHTAIFPITSACASGCSQVRFANQLLWASGTQSYSVSNFKMTKYTGAVGTMSGFGSDPFQHAVMEAGDVDIAADGTLKAPHGIFKVNVTSSSNSFDNMGTFIHNEGTVWNVASGGKFMKTGTVDPVFYNIACTANFEINYSITVENELNCYAIDIRDSGQQVLISLGTTISQGIGRGSMAGVPTAASGSWQIENNATYSHGVVGVSSQFPALIRATRSDGQSMIRNTGSAGAGLTLGNVIIDGTFGEWGNAASINLVGDVWIDHLYIQTGATFDTNSYTLTITSLTNHGTLSGDGAIIHTGTQGALLADVGSRDYSVDLDSVFSFDGTDDYLNAGDVLDFADNDEFTVSVWFRTTATERQVIVGKYLDRDANKAGWGIEMEADGTIKAGAGDGSYGWRNADSTLSYNDGYWHHIGWTVSGSNQRLLIDGVIVDTVSVTQLGSMESSYDLLIGAKNQNTANAFFTGEIADVKIYRDNLDHQGWGGSASVGELHRLGAYINNTGEASGPEILMVWWKLTNGSVKDSSYDGSSLSCLAGTTCSNYILGEYGTIEEIYPFTTEYRNGANANGDIYVRDGTLDLERTSIAEFNGVDDYVEIAGALDSEFSSAFTWSLWVKTDASSYPIGSEEYLLGAESASSNNWDVAFETDGQIRANYKSGGTAVAVTSSTSLDTGWNHIIWVVSCDDSNCTSGDAFLYINGLLEDDISHSINMSNTVYTKNAQIGDRNHTGNGPFDGDITDVRLYAHALTEEQALVLYTNQYPVTPDHWWFHEFYSAIPIEDWGRDSVTDVDGTFNGGWNHHSETHNSLFIASNGTYRAAKSSTTIDSHNSGGWAVNFENGYFDSNGGQLIFTGGSASAINLGDDGYPNHMQYNRSSSSCFAGPPWDQHLAGKLTVNSGTLDLCDDRIYIVAPNDGVKVTGGTLDFTGSTGAHEYGKLEITGGTFKAPDYAEISANGSARISWTGGTLVHNNGTFEITGGNGTGINAFGTTGNLYNLILNNGECDVCSISLLGYSTGTPAIIEGDLTAIRGTIIPNTGTHDYTVYGTTTIHSAAIFNNSSTAGDWVYHGIVTNYGDYTFSSKTNTFHGGFRNLGTTHGSSTATFVGTGGIWEGDLDDVDVDIDLDNAFEFVDGNDIVEFGDLNEFNTPPFSISFWLQYDAVDDTAEHIINKDGDWCLYIDSANKLRWDVEWYTSLPSSGTLVTKEPSPGGLVTDGSWHHLTLTLNDNSGTLETAIWVDGIEVATGSVVGTLNDDASDDFGIGGSVTYGGAHWDGYMADVRAYDSILSESDIQSLSASIGAMAPTTPTPMMWWKLNDASSGSGLPQDSIGTNHATSNDADWISSPYSIVAIGDGASTGGEVDIINGTLDGLGLSSLEFAGLSESSCIVVFTCDYVEIPHQDSLEITRITLSYWVNPTTLNGWDTHISKIETDPSQRKDLYIVTYEDQLVIAMHGPFSGDWHTGVLLTTDTWYHIVITYDGTTIEVYRDGILEASKAESGDLSLSTGTVPLYFGMNTPWPVEMFDGSMRDVKLYDYALSEEQAEALYAGSYPVTPAHGWKMGGSMADGLEEGINGYTSSYGISDGTAGAEMWEGPASRFDSGTYDWYTGWDTISNDNGTLKIVHSGSGNGTYQYLNEGNDLNADRIAGHYYAISFDAKYSGTSGGLATVRFSPATGSAYDIACVGGGCGSGIDNQWQRFTFIGIAAHATNDYIYFGQFSSGEIIWIDNFTMVDLGPAPGTMSGTMTDSSFTHATFDLDSTGYSMYIRADGTVSAPRGNLEIAGVFQNKGTFHNNNGTVAFKSGTNHYVNSEATSLETVFYNVTVTDGQLRLYSDTTIQNILDITSGAGRCYVWNARTLTMGTETSSGHLINNGGSYFWFYSYQSPYVTTLQGVSSEHPVIVTGDSPFEFGYDGGITYLKWVDWQTTFRTNSNGNTSNTTGHNITFTGDNEFDRVVIEACPSCSPAATDTFNLAGYTAYVTSIDNTEGTITGSTIEFVGSGGYWAGDLASSDVNVNLDAAMTFDSVGDHLGAPDTAGDLNVGTGDFSLSVWFKTEESGPQVLIANGNAFRYTLYLNDDGHIATEIDDDDCKTSINKGGPLNDGSWHHAIMTIDRDGVGQFYVDGHTEGTSFAMSSCSTGTLDDTGYDFLLGQWSYDLTSGAWWNGEIKDARVYKSVLSSSDIATLSSSMGVSTAASPAGWWLLNEGTGEPQDSSGNMNHLVSNGATWTFDEFSIKLHPVAAGSGTGAETDGDVLVTSGTLEGLSLSKMNFNGTNNSVWMDDDPGDFTAISMSIWVFPHDATPSEQGIMIMEGGDNGIATGSASGYLRIKHEGVSSGTFTDTAYAWQQDTWQHVAFTWNGSTLKVYVDGVEINSVSLSGSPWGTSNIRLGCFQKEGSCASAGDWPFDGELRDARIYGYALSDEQMAAVYADSYPVTPDHMWKLDQGSWTAWNIYDTGWATAVVGNTTATYQNAHFEIGRLAISGATVSAPRGIMELDNSGMVLETISGATYIHNNGEIEVTVTQNPGGLSIVRFRSGTGTPFDLTIDVGSGTPAQWDRDLTVSGTLWIDTGVFSSSATQRDITVVANTQIDYPGRLNCASGKICSLGAAFTSGHAVVVANGGVLDGGSSVMTIGSLDGGWGADVTFSSATTTFSSTNLNNNRVLLISRAGSFDFDNGEVIFTGTLTQDMYLDGDCDIPTTTTHCRTFNDFTVNKASGTLTWPNSAAGWADIYISGNLKIESGTFDTESNYNNDIYVTGEFNHTGGTFTSNSSIVTVRNLVITNTASTTFNAPDASGMLNITGEGSSGSGDGYAFRRVSGAFVDNSGTVTFKLGGDYTSIRMGTAAQNFHNVIIDESTSGGIYYVNDEGFTVTGDLTLTDGDFDTGYGSTVPLIDIQGTLSIGNHNTFGGISGIQTSDISIGCLIIASSGATFIGSSGTTTITKDCNSGNVWQNLRGDNGYVHNNGTVDIHGLGNYNGNVVIYENSFYNLIVNMNSTSDNCYWNDISGGVIKIEGDLTITNGEWKAHAGGDDLIIYGTTYVGPTGTFHNTAWHNYTNVDVTHYGLVTVDSLGAALGLYDATPANNLIYGGFRNLGGTVNGSTLTFVGSGGIWEGDLGTADVDINLDEVLNFDGNNDYIEVPHSGSFDITTAATFSVWINSSDLETLQHIMSKDWVWAFLIWGDSNRFNLYFDGNDHGSNSTISGLGWGDDEWHHIAVVFGSDEYEWFFDGVPDGVQSAGGDVIATDTSDVVISGVGGPPPTARFYSGILSDLRMYDTRLDETEVALLASRIGITTATTPEAWWLLNDGSSAANSGYCGGTASNCDGTISGATWLDSPFSIVAQGEDTGTGGDVDIQQGTLEGLGLTILRFDGSNDYVDIGDSNNILTGNTVTFATWFKVDPSQTAVAYLISTQKGTGSTNMTLSVNQDDGGNAPGYVSGLVWDSGLSTHKFASYDAGINDGLWHHLVYTTEGSTQVLYLDGVQVATGTGTFVNAASVDHANIGNFNGGGTGLDGDMADVRIYDYALSADQAASLYGGSYIVTPLVGFKLDDGGGNCAGWGTILNGPSNGITNGFDGNANSGFQNADLDFDGDLTIGAGTTLSAPRGNLHWGGGITSTDNGNFDNFGTFTHNGGTFITHVHDHTTPSGYIQNTGTVEPVFYNLTIDVNDSGHGDCQIDGDITVENILATTSSGNFRTRGYTLTLGTLSGPGTFAGNGGGVEDMKSAGTGHIIKAASSSHPAVIADGTYIKYQSSTWYFSDVDFQIEEATGGAGATIIQTGDVWVMSLHVQTGDEWDHQSYSLYLGKDLGSNDRVIDIDGTFNPSAGKLYITGNTAGQDIRAHWNNASPFNVIINLTNSTDTLNADPNQGQFAPKWDFTILKGIYNTDSTANHPITVGRSMDIQDEGTLTPNSSTVTVAGSWDSSGLATITNGNAGWTLVLTGTGDMDHADNQQFYNVNLGQHSKTTDFWVGALAIHGVITLGDGGTGGAVTGNTEFRLYGAIAVPLIVSTNFDFGTIDVKHLNSAQTVTGTTTNNPYNNLTIQAHDVHSAGDVVVENTAKIINGTWITNGYDITTDQLTIQNSDLDVTGGSDINFDHTSATNGFGTSDGDLNAEGYAGLTLLDNNLGNNADYIDLGGSPYNATADLTFSSWLWFPDIDGYPAPVSLFSFNGTGDGSFSIIDDKFIAHTEGSCYRYFSATTPTNMKNDVFDGDWHHIVFYMDFNDSTKARVFIDGTEQTGDLPLSGGCAGVSFTNNWRLGDGSYGHFWGGMADVRVYEGDKSSALASSLYAGGNPATNEGNVYTDDGFGQPSWLKHWWKLNDGGDFAGGAADSGWTGGFNGTVSGTVKSGEVLITSTSATPTNYIQLESNSMSFNANHTTFSGFQRFLVQANKPQAFSNCTFTNGKNNQNTVYFAAPVPSSFSFTHNTITANTSSQGLRLDFPHNAFDNIVITNAGAGDDIYVNNIMLEFTNSNFDLTKIALQTSGNLVSRNHNDVPNTYHVLATTLNQSDITNKVVPADTNLYLETGTWELDENANFQTATLTINSGTLEVTADNTWGTVTPANVNSYPIIEGAVLYWWNAVFNPMAVTRDEYAGLIAGNINGTVNYEIYGKADFGDASVGYTPTSANAVILRAPDCSLPFLQYCTVYTMDNADIVQMLNLTIYNHSKWHQQQGSISEYHPGSDGAYIFVGGLWSVAGDGGDIAEARRLSSLPNGIWNLTPQNCRPDSLHISLANIRHEFEPCGMIPYFASTGSDNWPGNDTVWFDGLISVTDGVQINTPSGIILGNPEATTFNISVIVLSNITQPENLSVDFWYKRMDNPDTVINECDIDKAIEQGYLCNVWTMIVMDNHLDGNYSLEFSHWYPGEYEYFFEANDTKNDITDKFTFKMVKPPGPFDKFMALIPSVILIALFSVIIPLIGRFARIPL